MKIRSIIVDDEKNGRENLAGVLMNYCPRIDLIGEADSVKMAIDLIEKHNPDLVFLDIEMPAADGFVLLEHFKEYPFEVIFVTAYDNYAIKAIRFSAADYILKPINAEDLKNAVNTYAPAELPLALRLFFLLFARDKLVQLVGRVIWDNGQYVRQPGKRFHIVEFTCCQQ